MKGFESVCQAVCTSWCLIALLVGLVSSVLAHMAVTELVDPLIDLPTNLETGLQTTFHFEELETDIGVVKNQSTVGLGKCQITTCPTTSNLQANVQSELAEIQRMFDKALTTVDKVANDKYLGIGDFRTLGDSLDNIQVQLTQMQNASGAGGGLLPCDTIGPAFCEIQTKAQDVINVMGDINSGIDKITNNEAVEQFEKNGDRFKNLLFILPWFFWISVLFYLCFFMTKKPSCKGGCLQCVTCSFHTVFFLPSFILSIVLFVAGIVVVRFAQDTTLDDPFVGGPTLKQLVDHIETTFPEFYNVVLRDLLNGLAKIYQAYLVMTVAHIFLLIHTCTCCCGIYVTDKESS